jgi:hypothetical protein
MWLARSVAGCTVLHYYRRTKASNDTGRVKDSENPVRLSCPIHHWQHQVVTELHLRETMSYREGSCVRLEMSPWYTSSDRSHGHLPERLGRYVVGHAEFHCHGHTTREGWCREGTGRTSRWLTGRCLRNEGVPSTGNLAISLDRKTRLAPPRLPGTTC